MSYLIIILTRICFFQAEPKDIPYSTRLLFGLIFTKIIVNYITLSQQLQSVQAIPMLGFSILCIVITASFLYMLLKWRQMSNRFVQSLSAFLGIDIFFKALAFFVLNMSFGQSIFMPLLWMIFVWDIAAVSFVLGRSIDISMGYAVMIVFGFNIFLSSILQGLMAGGV